MLPETLKKRLVESLIFPYLDYCTAAFTDITEENNLRLQRALNACVRFILRLKWDDVSPYLLGLGWLRIRDRKTYFVGCLLFNILSDGQPLLLFDKFNRRLAPRNTRAATDLLELPRCRTQFFKRSFMSYAAELWNGIPPKVRNSKTVSEFKDAFYSLLLERGGT